MANESDQPRDDGDWQREALPPRIEQVAEARYWSLYYRDGYTPWDMGHETPVFRDLRERGRLPLPPRHPEHGHATRVFVPGCGSGHDALALANDGYEVTALDFAPEALAMLRNHAAKAAVPAERLHLVEADVFNLPASLHDAFDIALEYT